MEKPIAYTEHAKVAMSERGLDPEWVEASVRNPQWVEADPDDPEVVRHFRSVPEHGGRYLRVALVETVAEFRILSAFFDRRARPK
ncbi:DUF4258 domain-containing protein [Devosia nitrariae]|uniref:DUF4258 domain-containing protein n=1 Tax=Devosia nitrariae TaxID=2071872 RepID=A0ABQ5WE99_9HYPH|nr:DUF4258 domain-containing protein [Devosia nitrariae]GLQ58162.1 hypothetical protein GCM10010862_54210 [Devosia nitrariae]